MSQESSVTVVTPSYNQGQFIRATINSVLGQSYRNIEYFVIDGGSTDNTVEILQQFDDPRFHWISERDSGQSDAINKGLQRATGDYLTYLNSDDLLLPGAVADLVDCFASHPEADLIYGDCTFINETGTSLEHHESLVFDVCAAVSVEQILLQPGAFWRRRVTEQIGLFDETLHYVMDFDYWIRAALEGYVLRYVPGTRSAFRLHASSKTVREKVGFWNDWNAVLDKVYSRQELSDQLLAVKGIAYRNVHWNRLKAEWATGSYDPAALRPYLRTSSLKYQVIGRVMQLESMSRLPLLSWLDAGYASVTGKRIIR